MSVSPFCDFSVFSVQTSFVLDQRNTPVVQMAPVEYLPSVTSLCFPYRLRSFSTSAMHRWSKWPQWHTL